MPSRSRTVSSSAIPTVPIRNCQSQADLLQRRGDLAAARDRFNACLPPRRGHRLARHNRLGVRLDFVSDDKQQCKLEVLTAGDETEAVRPGVVDNWNKLRTEQAQPKLRIIPGDKITAVNHSSERMLEQIDTASHMTLSIERDRPGILIPLPSLPSISQSRHRSSSRPSLPRLPSMNCDKRKLSLSECSTRESTPRSRGPSPLPNGERF